MGTTVVEVPGGGGVALEVLVHGRGDDVVLLPSALRPASDFVLLARLLADAGYRTLAVNPRGAGGSTGPVDGLSMRDVAADVAAVIRTLADGSAHVVGHALGNTFARGTATYEPDVVRSLSLLACGGHDLGGPGSTTPPPEVMVHFARCHDESATEAERLESLGVVFFAPGGDPSPWLHGWETGSQALSGVLQRGDWREWWLGGSAPMLIVQPLDDVMAPPSVGRHLAAAVGERARYVELADCGHAVLPEQPEAVAVLLVDFLQSQA